MNRISLIVVIVFLVFSCGNGELPIPKPPTYLRLDLPAHNYSKYKSECGYSFQAASIFSIKGVTDTLGKLTCHKDIDIEKLNAIIHFSFIDMKEPLSKYVNFANDKVDEHKLKATAIEDFQIVRKDQRVFGTLFELQGDVASPFQFYLTDSTSKFVSGVVYFNTRPNYDSLKPSLDYLKVDLLKMVNTFEW